MSKAANSALKEPAVLPELVDLFRPYTRLQLTRGDEATYQRFRCRESNLVSYLDEHGSGEGQRRLQVLVLRAQDQSVGTVSFIVETNRHRPGQANKFARINLVMMDPSCHGLGFGRLLILCVMIHLLKGHGLSLYSISCLAAHGAVEKCLPPARPGCPKATDRRGLRTHDGDRPLGHTPLHRRENSQPVGGRLQPPALRDCVAAHCRALATFRE